jgi:Fe-S cluster assembly ATPase SufC
VCELVKTVDNDENTLIIITHYFKILEYIDVDEVHIMQAGKLAKS